MRLEPLKMNIKRNNTLFNNMLRMVTEIAMRCETLIGMTLIVHSAAVTVGYMNLHDAIVQTSLILGSLLVAREATK
tara:strand:- start:1669 stop:1896 length:228 start_codon:yes stop_codon:yes gene_type:complete